jgi:hypothetical protein
MYFTFIKNVARVCMDIVVISYFPVSAGNRAAQEPHSLWFGIRLRDPLGPLGNATRMDVDGAAQDESVSGGPGQQQVPPANSSQLRPQSPTGTTTTAGSSDAHMPVAENWCHTQVWGRPVVAGFVQSLSSNDFRRHTCHFFRVNESLRFTLR